MLLGGYFLANFTIHATIQYWYLVCIFALLEIGYHFFHSHLFQGIQLNKKNSAAIQSQMSCFYILHSTILIMDLHIFFTSNMPHFKNLLVL